MLDENTAPRALVLPPPYTAFWLPDGDVMSEACRRAPQDGAGSLVWQLRTGAGQAGRLDFAVVLEPETQLSDAQRAFVIGMVALGDALAAHCPPERAVSFGWPGELLLDQGRLGGMRFAVPPGASADEVPDWIALAVELIADRDHLTSPGSHPASVSLKEEEISDAPAVLESFAAHLMLNFDRWAHEGFAPVASRYSERLLSGGALDATGDLLLDDGIKPLSEALSTALWRDEKGPIL